MAGNSGAVNVPIAKSHLVNMGIDPKSEMEVSRTVLDTKRDAGEMRLRFYEEDEVDE